MRLWTNVDRASRRPIAFEYASAFGLGLWALLVVTDPTPLDKVVQYKFLTVFNTPEWFWVTLVTFLAIAQLAIALSNHPLMRKFVGVACSAQYFLFANGVGTDNAHAYGGAGWWALCIGNVIIAVRTL